ncbi:hypothetical protein AAK899_05560 [Erysipelotrichaceae bacterium 51-3]|uniref:hypothetical protein n=1 Tax=Allobaculum sp. JKK-2023 TaxID=3108943 RepID=UPI002B05D809|nr:hypothetical protein [Allobaculum sp. JKK-2023]
MIDLAEQNSPIDVYYDMDIAQICQHFNKSRNTVDKAVAKLVKNYPDRGWKYKNPETKRITIRAEGVEKLSTYFRKEKQEISTVETELRMEIEKLNAILQEKDKTIANLEVLYNERLKLELDKSAQTFLLEQKSKDEKITELDTKVAEQTTRIDEQDTKITEQSDQILKQTEEISSLKTENQILQDEKKIADDKQSDLESQLSEYRKKEEEYNSKSFFYRLTHKFSLS